MHDDNDNDDDENVDASNFIVSQGEGVARPSGPIRYVPSASDSDLSTAQLLVVAAITCPKTTFSPILFSP